MDRIVWDGSIVGDFTDRLRRVLRHLEDNEALLHEVSSSLEYVGTGKPNDAVAQIRALIREVSNTLASLDETTASLRRGMYQTMELFETTERQNVNRVLQSGADITGHKAGGIYVETGKRIRPPVITPSHADVNPVWLVNLASDNYETKRR